MEWVRRDICRILKNITEPLQIQVGMTSISHVIFVPKRGEREGSEKDYVVSRSYFREVHEPVLHNVVSSDSWYVF